MHIFFFLIIKNILLNDVNYDITKWIMQIAIYENGIIEYKFLIGSYYFLFTLIQHYTNTN